MSGEAAAGTLVVFAKAPVLGAVKTRLAAAIGDAEALAFYRACLAGLLDRVSGDGRWDTLVAATPDGAAAAPGMWPGRPRLLPQGNGDLGRRMARPLARASPDRPVVIVGSDIPELGAGDVAAAFAALRDHDLVVGPSRDGGYWLIGASRPPPDGLFDGVRWSSPTARADTLRNASGLSVATLRELEDVDDAPSYARWRARSGQAEQEAPPRTQNLAQ